MEAKREELIAIVGAGNVADDAQTLENYSRDQSFAVPRNFLDATSGDGAKMKILDIMGLVEEVF
ncbi:MAG: hypothetical protein ABSD13_13915 [Candidatus Korobacteraceae bacterium]|jgi:hypothetical protein